MYRILVVEDDEVISREVAGHLRTWGYEVERVMDFSDVLGEFMRFAPQLVLMDVGLPFYNGYYWCGEIRKISGAPVIFISSAGDNMNIVMAVNMGGDDYLTKPFDLQVLLAKVQAMLRRAYAFGGKDEFAQYGGVLLNIQEAALFYGESKTELTRNELRIIRLLFENPEQIVSREELMKRLWDNDCFVDDNTLTVNMNRLRKKLEEQKLPFQIVTKKGLGYRLGEKEA